MTNQAFQDFIPSAARAMTGAELQTGMSGYRITHSFTPQDDISRIMKAGKSYLTPILSPEANDLCETDYSWLSVYREDVAVASLGLRRYSLGSECFSEFWTRTMNRHYGNENNPAVRRTSQVLDREIQGDCVYFGDLFVSKEIAGFKLFSNLVFYGIAYAMLKWSPTCLFAFITQENFNRGIKSAFNFTISLPAVVEWNPNPDNRETSEVCLVLPGTHATSVFRNDPTNYQVNSRE